MNKERVYLEQELESWIKRRSHCRAVQIGMLAAHEALVERANEHHKLIEEADEKVAELEAKISALEQSS